MSAKEAFKAYIRAYESHSLKQIFNVQTIDLRAVGQSFGFGSPPHVDIGVGVSHKDRARKRKPDDAFDRYAKKKKMVFKQGMGKGPKKGGKFAR